MKELLEAGVHFGHQTRRWNPRMKPYIFGERGGIHIINLEQTVPLLEQALAAVTEIVAGGGDLLFVGTKRQAQLIIAEEAQRCGMHYVNNRWLGGTLTNFTTIKSSIDRLKELEAKMADGSFDVLTKKERRRLEREMTKLKKALAGIKEMAVLPAALFIMDPQKEAIAQREANRLGITVIAVADTNCDPEGIDYLIPGNDDAIKAIRIFTQAVAGACLAGLEKRQERIRAEVAAEMAAESKREETAKEEKVEVVTERAKAYVSRDRELEAKPKRKAARKKKPDKGSADG